MRKRPLIIFDDNNKNGGAGKANISKQNTLLRGLLMTGGDFKESAKLAGIHTAAEAYRTWDRLSIRKGYHEALADEGVSLRWIVRGLKQQAENSESDQVKLSALRTLLGSLGLTSYTVDEEGARGWEEVVLNVVEKEAQTKVLNAPAVTEGYEVKKPEVPESAKLQQKKETELGKELYGNK